MVLWIGLSQFLLGALREGAPGIGPMLPDAPLIDANWLI